VGGPGTPPFGARGRISVRYGTRLGDLKENWFLLFSNQTLNTHAAILAHAGGALYGTELGSVTLKRIGFFCFPIKHSTHTWFLLFPIKNSTHTTHHVGARRRGDREATVGDGRDSMGMRLATEGTFRSTSAVRADWTYHSIRQKVGCGREVRWKWFGGRRGERIHGREERGGG